MLRGRRISISWGYVLLLIVVIVITFLPFYLAATFTNILDNTAIAYDWRTAFHNAIWTENFGWGIRGLYTPPWSVWLILPITALSFQMGWAVLMYLTMISLVIAVPRQPSRNLWLGATFLLLTSHPALRNFADLNVAAFVIGGLLIATYAYNEKKPYLLSLGLLLAAIKPQEVFLVFAVIGLYMLKTFHWQIILKVIISCGGIFIFTMLLWGEVWFGTLGVLPLGISINGGLTRVGTPQIIVWTIQLFIIIASIGFAYLDEPKLDKTKVGLLVTGSILAAPYANGLSLIVSLAFGGVAVFMKRPLLGLFIFFIYNLPYSQAVNPEWFTLPNDRYYMTIQMILWGILIFDVYQASKVETNQLFTSQKTGN